MRVDFNLDRHIPNNPESRQDLKLLIPVFEECLANNNLQLINSKPTRHRYNQKSTLIDLIIVDNPLKCNNWVNVVNLTSEHEGVIFDYNTTDALIKDQFRVVRDTRRLNAVTILEKLEEINYFNEELKVEDVNEMTERIKTKKKK